MAETRSVGENCVVNVGGLGKKSREDELGDEGKGREGKAVAGLGGERQSRAFRYGFRLSLAPYLIDNLRCGQLHHLHQQVRPVKVNVTESIKTSTDPVVSRSGMSEYPALSRGSTI